MCSPSHYHCNAYNMFRWQECGCIEWCSATETFKYDAQPRYHALSSFSQDKDKPVGCWGGGWPDCGDPLGGKRC